MGIGARALVVSGVVLASCVPPVPPPVRLKPPPAPETTRGPEGGALVRLLEALDRSPGIRPVLPPGEGEGFVRVTFLLGPQESVTEANVTGAVARPAFRTMRREQRDGSRPDYWVVVVDSSTGVPVGWAPAEDPRVVRVETAGPDGAVRTRYARRKQGIASVVAPFRPSATVFVVRGDDPTASPIVSFQYGATIADPVLMTKTEKDK